MCKVLIIGQGIAGTVLALTLQDKNIPYLVVDDGHRTASSLVAAGLYNPLILKRGNLTWRAQEFLPDCERFYRRWEEEWDEVFLHATGLHRRIHDAQEYNNWTARMADKEIGPFIEAIVPSERFPKTWDLPMSLCKVKGGWVDVASFLTAAQVFFKGIDSYKEALIDLRSIEKEEGNWKWDSLSFKQIVLCTGYRSADDQRFFPGLPFNPAKGHTLILHVPGAGLDEVLNANVFVIPLGDDHYRVGSTYSWVQLNEEVEDAEVQKLELEFKKICKLPYSIAEKKAGVRPAVNDRRPLIGESLEHKGIWHFGGFGSRAVISCPSLAASFLKSLDGSGAPDAEIYTNRYSG